MIDFKISSILRNGGYTEVKARFYSGAVTTENEPDTEGNDIPVERYRRTAKLDEKVFVLRGDVSDDDINSFLKAELHDMGKTETDTPIPEQALKDDAEAATNKAKVDVISST